MPGDGADIHPGVPLPDRSGLLAAAHSVLEQGGWWVVERCLDVPGQQWEPRLIILTEDPEEVADAVVLELAHEPERDARLVGCDRRTLRPDHAKGAHLCHLADMPASPTTRRSIVLVRDGMNAIVVTVRPDHSLREAARPMTARGVGAAVVIDDEQPGPGIITNATSCIPTGSARRSTASSCATT